VEGLVEGDRYMCWLCGDFTSSSSSYYINNRQPITESLSKVLSRLAGEVRVDARK
jgi:hypothetical protein